jgi:hypothetical protein
MRRVGDGQGEEREKSDLLSLFVSINFPTSSSLCLCVQNSYLPFVPKHFSYLIFSVSLCSKFLSSLCSQTFFLSHLLCVSVFKIPIFPLFPNIFLISSSLCLCVQNSYLLFPHDVGHGVFGGAEDGAVRDQGQRRADVRLHDAVLFDHRDSRPQHAVRSSRCR